MVNLAYFTFGTLVGFWRTGMVIFGMFGTPVALHGTLKIGSVFSTLSIIPSEYTGALLSFVNFTLNKLQLNPQLR